MRYAVKRLTRSDLTFFEHQYRRQNAGNQKSINLNRNVFVDLIFPAAADATGGSAKQFPIPVRIYGPGLRSQPHVVTRKVIAAGGRQKNWRLNGEFVPDPEFDPQRYRDLQAGDLAVFGFESDSGLPAGAHIVLLAENEKIDADLLSTLRSYLGPRSMAEINASTLQSIIDSSPAEHALRELLETERDEALQEAALGSAAGTERLLRQPSMRRMTTESLAAARLAAEATGRDGEVLVNEWLQRQVANGRLLDATWIAETNAINPWDFEVTELSGQRVRVEVKSTNGAFERPIHISQAEVLAAALGDARTDLYRVFGLNDDSGFLRISSDIRSTVDGILILTKSLPAGVVPDGYSITTENFASWTEPTTLRFDNGNDQE